MSSSKKTDLCLSVWGPEPHMPPPPLLLTYVYTSIITHTGKGGEGGGGGGIEPEAKVKGAQFTKLGRKYQHDWLYLQSINSDKHMPQSPFSGKFF
jgi:hypothetical protein